MAAHVGGGNDGAQRLERMSSESLATGSAASSAAQAHVAKLEAQITSGDEKEAQRVMEDAFRKLDRAKRQNLDRSKYLSQRILGSLIWKDAPAGTARNQSSLLEATPAEVAPDGSVVVSLRTRMNNIE